MIVCGILLALTALVCLIGVALLLREVAVDFIAVLMHFSFCAHSCELQRMGWNDENSKSYKGEYSDFIRSGYLDRTDVLLTQVGPFDYGFVTLYKGAP